jgi:hypothetical protein
VSTLVRIPALMAVPEELQFTSLKNQGPMRPKAGTAAQKLAGALGSVDHPLLEMREFIERVPTEEKNFILTGLVAVLLVGGAAV